jgi:hypothetical protein
MVINLNLKTTNVLLLLLLHTAASGFASLTWDHHNSWAEQAICDCVVKDMGLQGDKWIYQEKFIFFLFQINIQTTFYCQIREFHTYTRPWWHLLSKNVSHFQISQLVNELSYSKVKKKTHKSSYDKKNVV